MKKAPVKNTLDFVCEPCLTQDVCKSCSFMDMMNHHVMIRIWAMILLMMVTIMTTVMSMKIMMQRPFQEISPGP